MSVVLTYNDPKLNGTIEFMVRAMDATSRRTIHEHRFDLKDLDACATFARQAAHMLGIASVEPLLFEQLCAKLLEVTADMPRMRSVRDLCAAHPKLRAPVIEGVLREGETMNLISAPKIGKSWLAQQLAISIAAERMWLGRFAVEPGNVLIIDNELHSETLAHRIPKVAAAVGVTLSELGDRLFVESFRGRLRDIYQMGSYFKHIDRGRFKLIIIDAFYRILPAGVDENSNADIAAIYNQIDRYADEMQTAFCLIHHSSKGIQAAKAVTDVGAGAGSQSRATKGADPSFADALADAERQSADVLEGVARHRAAEGIARKKFYRGEPLIDPETGQQYVEREYSDTLLIFLLKGRNPEVFGEKVKVQNDVRLRTPADGEKAATEILDRLRGQLGIN